MQRYERIHDTLSLHPLTLSRQDLAYHGLIKRRHKIDSKKKKGKSLCRDYYRSRSCSDNFHFSFVDQTVNLRLVGFSRLLPLRDSRSRSCGYVLASALPPFFYASKVFLPERSRDEIRVDDNRSGDNNI